MSSGSDSDEDFVPGEPEQLSEEGSADEETDLQYEKDQEIKTNKRKAIAATKGTKRLKATRNAPKEPTPEPEKPQEDYKNPEDEKKREEDLWAMFLDGTDTKTKSKVEPAAPKLDTVKSPTNSACDSKTVTEINNATKKDDDAKSKETRIFEFAGETIVVENNIIKEKIKSSDCKAAVSKPTGPPLKGRATGGLSDVLGQLNKKNKLSTLEKSKLDWETYKKETGVDEEVQSHNKGKQGYLERQDFLQRADLRQYEIERDMRMSRRSNR